MQIHGGTAVWTGTPTHNMAFTVTFDSFRIDAEIGAALIANGDEGPPTSGHQSATCCGRPPERTGTSPLLSRALTWDQAARQKYPMVVVFVSEYAYLGS
jgi:hypothetical protein